MIKWNEEYYNHEKRANDDANLNDKHFPTCAHIDVLVCTDGLSFAMPDSICMHACYGDDLSKCFDEINDTVIKEFPNLFNSTYFTVHNAPWIRFKNN